MQARVSQDHAISSQSCGAWGQNRLVTQEAGRLGQASPYQMAGRSEPKNFGCPFAALVDCHQTLNLHSDSVFSLASMENGRLHSRERVDRIEEVWEDESCRNFALERRENVRCVTKGSL